MEWLSLFALIVSRKRLRLQPVDATHALNLSAGVSNSNVSRGRSFNSRATLLSVACECTDKSVPFGKYCLSKDAFVSYFNLILIVTVSEFPVAKYFKRESIKRTTPAISRDSSKAVIKL